MANKLTIRESIAVLQTQNIQHTKSIDSLTKAMTKHDEASQTFRQTVKTNSNDISWLRWGMRGLYGPGLLSLVVGLIVWFVRR